MKYALRSLLKTPGYTIVALITLALGIGANTAMFSLVNALLLQHAPYPEADRLVRLYRTASQSQSLPHSLIDFRDEKARSQTFASLTVYQNWAYSLAEPDQPAEHLSGVTASADLFSTLGVQPILGRSFTADEQQPGRDDVTILSYQCWRQRFSGDPQIIGRTLRMDGESVTVIGVMPESAAYPLLWGAVDVWRPLRLSNDWRQQRGVYWLNMIGRLRPGVSLAQARVEMDGVSARLAEEFSGTNAGTGLRLLPLHESVMADAGKQLTWLTLGLAGFVLLIACANLANLQLARAAANARTYAVQIALGAPRRVLVQQSLFESMLLALAGGGLGLLLAGWLNQILGSQIAIGEGGLPLPIDRSVLGFVFFVSIAVGALFGAVPAWVVSRADVNDTLKRQARGSIGDRSQHRFRHGLVVGEIILTVVLLSGAGLFLRGLQRFAHRDLGWRSTGLLTGTLSLPNNRYPTNEQRRLFYERLIQRLETLPGVEHVSLSTAVPITAVANAPLPVYAEGRPATPGGKESLTRYCVVSPHFFETMQIQLVRGRLFPENLRPNSPSVAVINETSARALWPGQDPIGKRLSRDGQSWQEVIGVVRDVRFAADLGAPETRLQVYQPLVLDPWAYMTIALRAAAPESLMQPLRRAVAELDADLPVDVLRTVDRSVDQSQHYFRLANQILGGFAALALFLSALGLYGLISGIVVRRTPEFGLRVALGAQERDVMWLVLNTGLRLALLGVAIGIAGSIGLARVLGAIVPELPAQDPWTIGAVSLLLVAVAVVACTLPARRALRVDPVIALRAE